MLCFAITHQKGNIKRNLTTNGNFFLNTEEDGTAELLKLIKETNEEWNLKLDEIAEWMTRLDDAISSTKQYEKVIMTQKTTKYWTVIQTRTCSKKI